MTEQHRYRHYGLTVACNIPLPLPPAGPGPADVVVEVRRAQERPRVDGAWTALTTEGAWRAPDADGSRLRVQLVGAGNEWADFVIDAGGAAVRATLGETSSLTDAGELLTSSVFSCVLAQRGLTCVHGAVVRMEDQALALVGPSGTGKSTLASALAERGARLVSDDIAVIAIRDGVYSVAEGRPAVRMRPDSAARLDGVLEEIRPVWESVPSPLGKRYFGQSTTDPPGEVESVPEVRAGPAEAGQPWQPLSGVFLLSTRGAALEVGVRAIPPAQLLPVLIANRHLAHLRDGAGHRRDFDCLAGLVRQVPGYELLRPDDLGSLPAVVEAVLGSLANP